MRRRTTSRWVDQRGELHVAGVAVRLLEVVRAGWGALCLLAPGRVAAALGGGPTDEAVRVALRLLGAGHVLQAAVSAVSPGPALLRVGAVVDAVHAVTALVLAALVPSRARAALLDAAVAAAWCVASLRAARSAPARRARGRREQVAGALLRVVHLRWEPLAAR